MQEQHQQGIINYAKPKCELDSFKRGEGFELINIFKGMEMIFDLGHLVSFRSSSDMVYLPDLKWGKKYIFPQYVW